LLGNFFGALLCEKRPSRAIFVYFGN
jgi:hypothetical protein